jgi:predicted O-methyltransferase YrrM
VIDDPGSSAASLHGGPARAPVYAFSSDWAQHFVRNASAHLMHLAGQPIVYLEVGVFEGRSGCWMLDHVLTHPDSRYIGVDAWGWADGAEERARSNLASHGRRVTLVKGASEDVLRDRDLWQRHSIDLAYIDGCHRAFSVLSDSLLVWPLVKPGGYIVWDDYRFRVQPWKRLPRHLRPKEALDAFLMAVRGHYEPLFANYQLGIRKTAELPGTGSPVTGPSSVA